MLIDKHTQLILCKFKKILIAYSGGLDSTVLLYNLVKLRNKHPLLLRVIHINHNLCNLSNKWVEICSSQCKTFKVFFLHQNINIQKNSNIEKNARIERYKAIAQIIKHDEVLVTAHHLDDQCETFFLFLKRGSGPKGLSGIHQKNIINNIKLYRPLLNVTRKQILQYAIKNKLKWIEDSSNFDIKYDRNFLRNIILPKIMNRWPFFNKTVSRSAALCNEQEQLLNELINPLFYKLVQKNNSLFITPLYFYSEIKRNFIIRKWISYNECYYMPSKKMLSIIWNEIINCNNNANPKILIKKHVICKYKSFLHCIKYVNSLKKIVLIWKNFNKPLLLPNKLGKLIYYSNINSDSKKNIINIRNPENNEILYIKFGFIGKYYFDNIKKKKNIDDIWEDLSIPKWEREQIPLLFYNKIFIADLKNKIITKNGMSKNKNNFFIFWDKKC
ncbi:tRNA lysidine(34) synthetase TilS [Enterobacteriaceae endosymbiont of Donacia tomentosa]|uniref:tRNA lysidine(34) synthetase TilS n=1 Tax=Enterobacteriaceae endosymbiont of Donacia tomentosa TaxID=2675787 RepID=UPI001449AA85|nr:tRNA lysidine(34) synthetase TilS [Enterobacteriaceae endosymbiont of Donacia tomentosa]QJC31659.1 tRNA lysidine(34) synthetase TilS [Enterobacteriaceae endosymbiont of Donacia tomentosa]